MVEDEGKSEKLMASRPCFARPTPPSHHSQLSVWTAKLEFLEFRPPATLALTRHSQLKLGSPLIAVSRFRGSRC